ncbi:MAG: AAA family ATPase, partial [Candidatus Hydrothermarchaeota archaeon]|nr:AAA family ATPase [Candidatus Hydrothermarchaeota archaeon]
MIHISRISLKNFKSFKRISIPIPQGFTAIVGPNGSGKSNIVDAICFVLGRSSAKSLRAERFSDLIFNGGKKEKPASEAEVSLYLDNSGREIPIDSKEIKITRSIDASGNSVYRLNGKRTSRTEILDVLSAAKIQPDGHNIVLQGDVTRIVEMNPVERRGVIDEIAGIAEYDEKKRKALRELEKVSENVSKVEAVLNEVKEQLQKLEKEKNDALRHEFLKREIRRNKGIVLYSSRLEISAGIEKLNGAIQEEEERAKKIDRYLNILLLKLEVKKKELEKLNTDIILKEETEQFEIFRELEKLKNELTYHEEKLNAAKAEIAQLEGRYSKCSSGIAAVSGEIKNYEANNELLEKEQRSIENKISQLKVEVDKEYERISKEDKVALDKREKLTNARAKFEEERSKLLEVERENALLNERKAEKSRIYQELSREITEKKAKLDELNKLKKVASDERNNLDASLEKALSQKSALIDESVELRKKIQKSNAVIQFKIEELAGLRAKFGALEQIKKTFFNEAIEAVLKLKESSDGIYGTLAQLGRVNSKFSKALEAAAGRGLQFIVVDTDATAEKCINYLKEKRIGRATFLPLNKLQVAQPDANAKKIASKTYGFALELVDFDEKFKKAFAYVFRDTLVVKDLAFARSAIGEARMVTLDGDVVEKSGSMSGGFYKPSELSFEEVD